LADLMLPAYSAPNLRSESLDARFEAGMKEYASGNCRGAITALEEITGVSTPDDIINEIFSRFCIGK